MSTNKNKTCQKHKKHLEYKDGSLETLAEDIGDLHYESLVSLLDHLAVKLKKDSDKDRDGKRLKLSNALYEASVSIFFTKISIMKAWEICKPYMEKNK